MAIKVDLKDFPKVLKKYGNEMKSELRRATAKAVITSIPDIKKRSPVDTGEYVSSWDVRIDEKKVSLGNFAPHGPIIEYGARPFTPPLKPLLAWAKRVLRDPSQPPEYSKEVWQLARGVQGKIRREGMKPRHVLSKEIPRITRKVIDEMERVNPRNIRP